MRLSIGSLLVLLLLIKNVITEDIEEGYTTPRSGANTSSSSDPGNATSEAEHSVFDQWNATTAVLSTFATESESPNILDSNSSCAIECSKCAAASKAKERNNSVPTNGKIPLYITAFYEGPRDGGWDGSGCVPAIDMAFDDINARPDILPQYELRWIWNDTKCDAGPGSRGLFDQLFRDPTKIIILGGGCSPPANAIASTAHYWNLILVAYGAESPALSNRKLYPYLYRSISSATVYNYLRIRLLKEYGWKRVATIHENAEHFKLSMDHMHDLLKEANITLVTSESFFTDPRNQIENIKRQDTKIIIGNMFENTAVKVFCEAYKEGLTGEGYVWLMLGWYDHKFWEKPRPLDDPIDCTVEEMKEAVDGYIGTQGTLLNDPSIITVANMTSAEYDKRYRSRLNQPEYLKYDFTPYGTTAYDGAWTIGMMLDQAARVLGKSNTSKRLEDFTYNDSELKNLFLRLLADVQFEGVSGPLSFINGDRIGVVHLEQLQIGCLEGWIRHDSDCYAFVEAPLTWTEAEAECVKSGGHLANLREPDNSNFIESVWPGQSGLYWIGLHQSNKGWKWSDGDIDGGENMWIITGSSDTETTTPYCVAADGDGNWKAMDCDISLPYICKAQIELASQIVGFHDIRKDELRWISNMTWKGNTIPLDHTPEIVITYKQVQNGIQSYIFFVMCTLACMGVILALTFLMFNIKFRQQKYVKMSSPNLNNIIILGSLMIYSWVAISGIDNTLVSDWAFSLCCQIRVWLLSIGFVLSFGAMFSKTWRVYRVATFKKPKRRIITDQQLLLLVGILLIIDVTILTLWQIISPWYITTNEGFERDDPLVPNQKLQPYIDYCTCSWITYWLIASCGYKGLLLIFGMFLAWETRKVQISALNDSKLIGISVYNVVILCIIGSAISLIINDPSTLFIFTATIVLFCTTLTLLVIFVPKIISVYKYPKGEPVSTMTRTSTTDKENPTVNNENIKLRKRIIQLEEALRKSVGGKSVIGTKNIHNPVINDEQPNGALRTMSTEDISITLPDTKKLTEAEGTLSTGDINITVTTDTKSSANDIPNSEAYSTDL